MLLNWIKKIVLVAVLLLQMGLPQFAGAQYSSSWEEVWNGLTNGSADEALNDIGNCIGNRWDTYMGSTGDADKDNLKERLLNRQLEIAEIYNNVALRVHAMEPKDARKGDAEEALDTAGKVIDDYMCLDLNEEIGDSPRGPVPSESYLSLEEGAVEAINNVNRVFVAPVRPGAVPEGNLIDDFIPQAIRLLFRLATLAIFVSFVVSGVMFVIAFGNEDRVTKAKTMLYMTVLGFAFVVLAFAIVKAITDIDFFSII
jgi:hypothetical protein